VNGLLDHSQGTLKVSLVHHFLHPKEWAEPMTMNDQGSGLDLIPVSAFASPGTH
jgi:hypothetical protein